MARYFATLACVGGVVWFFFHAESTWERYAAFAVSMGTFLWLAGWVRAALCGVAFVAFANTDLGSDSMIDFVLWPLIGVGAIVWLGARDAGAVGGIVGGDGGGGDFGGGGDG